MTSHRPLDPGGHPDRAPDRGPDRGQDRSQDRGRADGRQAPGGGPAAGDRPSPGGDRPARSVADPPALRPGDIARPYTERTGRVAAARRLTKRPARETAREFLAEGPQAVREALTSALARPGLVRALLGTEEALDRHPDLAILAGQAAVPVSPITPRAAGGLSETTTPQGLVAVCRFLDVPLAAAFGDSPPRLAAVLVAVRDPGNAGTVLRTADAAGAGVLVLASDSVDPYNGKAVRASAGSLFHVPLVRGADLGATVQAARAAGLAVLAADASGETDLDDLADRGALAPPTAWLFGNEAHGLPPETARRADARVRIRIHGRAESLNLAAAAAVCLFASARAQRPAAGNRPGKIANSGAPVPPRAMP